MNSKVGISRTFTSAVFDTIRLRKYYTHKCKEVQDLKKIIVHNSLFVKRFLFLIFQKITIKKPTMESSPFR